MALLDHNMREEVRQHRFHPAVFILVPLFAIFLQSYLPLRHPGFALVDLPLCITVYFAVSRRNPVSGALLGTGIGMAQDALTHFPLGMQGIAKAIAGYLAASIGARIDVDNPGTRILMMFFFTLLDSLLRFVIERLLLNLQMEWFLGHELLRAAINALVAVILFTLLDRLRQRE
jgi:rod shape-determining protein MreD